MNQIFYVSGMTCGHCVNSVTEELSKIAGVEKVEVDLSTGKVEIKTNHEIERTKVEEAIKEAGYELN